MAKDDDLVDDWEALKPKKPEPVPKPAQGQAGVLDVNELRTATQRAIQEGVDKKRAAEDARVAIILQKATDKARKEAARGKNSCRVMKLQWEKDFIYVGEGSGRNRRFELKGLGKLVHDRLKAAQIQVDYERQNANSAYNEDIWLLLKW